jgi:hypothetical protein
MVMTLENPFVSGHNIEQNPAPISLTSIEAYLDMIKDSQIEAIDLEERIRTVEEDKNKIKSDFENALNDSLAKEMEKNGFFENIGYYPNGQELPLEDYSKYFGNGYTLNNMPILNEQHEAIGYNLYREKQNLSDEEQTIKSEIYEAYGKLSKEKWFYVEWEINSRLEKKVRDGKMVFLGNQTFDEYVGMIKRGVSTKETIAVPIFDQDMNPFDLNQKIYVWIK